MKVHRMRNVHIIGQREFNGVADSAVHNRPRNVVLERPCSDNGVFRDTNPLLAGMPVKPHGTLHERRQRRIEPLKRCLIFRGRMSDGRIAALSSIEQRCVQLAVGVMMTSIVVILAAS
jgi:hypothetical protein